MRRAPGVAFGLVVAFAVFATPARGQLSLDPPRGELGTSFDGSWFSFPEFTGPGQQTFQQWLRLRLGGSVRHPGLAAFNIDLQPVLAQTGFVGEPASAPATDNMFTGGMAIHLLSAARLAWTGSYWRADEDHGGRFGANTRRTETEWRAGIRDRNRVLPFRVDFLDRARDITSIIGPSATPFRTDDRTRRIRVTARNTKTGLLFERAAFEDRIRGLGFTNMTGRFDHLLRWGHDSRSNSQVLHDSRIGDGEFTRLSIRNTTRLQHASSVFSDFGHSRTRLSTLADVVTNHTATARTTVLLGDRIRLEADGYGEFRRSSAGTQTYLRAQPIVTITTPIPLGATLTASGSAGFEWHDQVASDDGLVQVVSERRAVAQDGRVELRRRFAVETTVTVRDSDGALFEPGIDYRVVTRGPFVDIVVLPAGRIAPGQTILIDYQFRIFPGAEANAFIWSYDFGINLGPARLYHRRRAQESLDDIPVAALPVLRNYDEMAIGFELQKPTSFGSVSAAAEHQRRRADTFDFTTNVVRAAATARPTNRISVALRGLLSSTRGGTSPLDILQAETDLEWQVSRRLTLSGLFSAWRWDEATRMENFYGVGSALRYTFRQLRLDLRYDRLSWTSAFDRLESRFVVRLTRAI